MTTERAEKQRKELADRLRLLRENHYDNTNIFLSTSDFDILIAALDADPK